MDKAFEAEWAAGKIAEGLTDKLVKSECFTDLTCGQIVIIQDITRAIAREEATRLIECVLESKEGVPNG